jgi:glycosyltransferase involved in cell wall biosynthesis
MCRISDLLHGAGCRPDAVLLWNANNTMGFERINWERLGYVTTITTVSRYMKHLMWRCGVNPVVVPNGIPRRLLRRVSPPDVAALRRSLGKPVVLSKVGRWDPDKRWIMAMEAVASLKAHGVDTTLIALGGIEPHEAEVMDRARGLGLRVRTVALAEPSLTGCVRAFREAGEADVLNVKSSLPLPVLQAIYAASDAVLANSGHEPFGLVGLEAMASGGVAITGSTGEDYAVHFENGIVVETANPEEASWYIRFLKDHPAMAGRIIRAGRRTARRFVWDRVVENLLAKIEFLAAGQGALRVATEGAPQERRTEVVPQERPLLVAS